MFSSHMRMNEAEWCTLIGSDLSNYCALIGSDHSVATPALFSHREPAQGTQSQYWGHFLPFTDSF